MYFVITIIILFYVGIGLLTFFVIAPESDYSNDVATVYCAGSFARSVVLLPATFGQIRVHVLR